MSIKYICDRCGKETPENERFEVKVSAKGSPTYYHPTDWGRKDLCQECADRIVRMAYQKAEIVNQDLVDAVGEMAEPLVSGWELATQLLRGTAKTKLAKTNLDRIREKPAEDLARLLSCGRCNFCGMDATECDMAWEEECEPEILKWLNQEVSE